MTTEADKNLEVARCNISAAIKGLSTIVVEECMGTSDYTETYRMKCKAAFDLLLQARREIQP